MHHLLAVDRGHGVDAKVDPLVAGPQGDGAVLGNALFGDVHLRQDLEPGDDHDEQRLRRRRQLVEDAVDPEAKLAAVLERFEVNIAGAVAQGLLENLVDHPDDAAVGVRRGRSVEVEDVLVLVLVVSVLFDLGELPALTDGLALLIGSVQGVDPGLDERQGGDHRVDPQPGQEFKFIDHSHFLGRDEGHVENFVADRHRADELVDAELLGQQDGKLVIRRAGQDDVRNQGQEQLLGVEAGDLLVRDVAALDQERSRAKCRGRLSRTALRSRRTAWNRTSCAGTEYRGSRIEHRRAQRL